MSIKAFGLIRSRAAQQNQEKVQNNRVFMSKQRGGFWEREMAVLFYCIIIFKNSMFTVFSVMFRIWNNLIPFSSKPSFRGQLSVTLSVASLFSPSCCSRILHFPFGPTTMIYTHFYDNAQYIKLLSCFSFSIVFTKSPWIHSHY